MASPLPVNAKGSSSHIAMDDDGLSVSLDRTSSIARLDASPMNTAMYGTSPSVRSIDEMSDRQVAKVVKRHLVGTSPAGSMCNDDRTTPEGEHSDGDIRSVHQLPGGAITHDVYKWTEAQLNQKKRSQSVFFDRSTPIDASLARLKDPGGFRRHFVVDRAAKQGRAPPHWMTYSFVDFLALYGHFGGEDLSDDEDEPPLGYRRIHGLSDEEIQPPTEETPLISPPEQDSPQGTATPSKAVFLLLKSFIGTGVMFLPKAFHNGGLLFSTVLLTLIAIVSLYSFLLLVQTRQRVPASFGDIGGILFGPTMRALVLFAITISQIGFVCAYMVFVAQNLQALIEAVSACKVDIPLVYLILVQVIIFVPLAMIRKIQKLSVFALIADVFILIGLAYLYYYDVITLVHEGVGKVEWIVNPSSFAMFIGTAVFTFEGVGLIIPIAESMKEPEKFPKVLSSTMLFITLLFLSIGMVSYLAFGEDVQTVILLNLPPSATVNTIQGLYALAICLSIPLQLFPAIRIVETGLFSRSGKFNPIVKWEKNLFRFATVVACAAAAIAGSADLDKFVSLVGSVCCIPLCFLFPPLFHLKAVAQTRLEKGLDVAIILFGLVSMVYTTFITVSLWTSEVGDAPPPLTRCPS